MRTGENQKLQQVATNCTFGRVLLYFLDLLCFLEEYAEAAHICFRLYTVSLRLGGATTVSRYLDDAKRYLSVALTKGSGLLTKTMEERLSVAEFQLEITSLPFSRVDEANVSLGLNLVYIFDDAMLRARKEMEKQQKVTGLFDDNDSTDGRVVGAAGDARVQQRGTTGDTDSDLAVLRGSSYRRYRRYQPYPHHEEQLGAALTAPQKEALVQSQITYAHALICDKICPQLKVGAPLPSLSLVPWLMAQDPGKQD